MIWQTLIRSHNDPELWIQLSAHRTITFVFCPQLLIFRDFRSIFGGFLKTFDDFLWKVELCLMLKWEMLFIVFDQQSGTLQRTQKMSIYIILLSECLILTPLPWQSYSVAIRWRTWSLNSDSTSWCPHVSLPPTIGPQAGVVEGFGDFVESCSFEIGKVIISSSCILRNTGLFEHVDNDFFEQ